MKKLILIKVISLFAFTLLLTATSFGQPDKKASKKANHEKIEKMKISFITNELDLSIEDSEKFWPIYNEQTEKLRAENKFQRSTAKELQTKYARLSDEEFKTKTDAIFDSESKEAGLKKEYTGKIAAVIGYKKAAKLLSLEQRFKRELLNKINRPEHPDRQGPPRGGRPDGSGRP